MPLLEPARRQSSENTLPPDFPVRPVAREPVLMHSKYCALGIRFRLPILTWRPTTECPTFSAVCAPVVYEFLLVKSRGSRLVSQLDEDCSVATSPGEVALNTAEIGERPYEDIAVIN